MKPEYGIYRVVSLGLTYNLQYQVYPPQYAQSDMGMDIVGFRTYLPGRTPHAPLANSRDYHGGRDEARPGTP